MSWLGHDLVVTRLIGPKGGRLADVPCGEERLLVYDLNLSLAAGFTARRFNPDFYTLT